MLTIFVLWVIFSFVFASRLPGTQQYAPYLMAGILLNTFFSQGVIQSAESIANNSAVLTKIYVPPQIFPIATSLAGLINFFIGMIPLAVVCYISGQPIAWTSPLVLIVGICLALLTSGVGLALSILYIRFDDAKNIVAVLLMILTYFTPVLYPISILSPKIQKLVAMNPLTSYLDIFRWAFSTNAGVTASDWLFMLTTSLVAIILGAYSFKKYWPRTVAML
jgi:ABC-type polysaccharide/polyol phosphate export permease